MQNFASLPLLNFMTDPYTFPRYLAAKTSVDDRALNKHVWQTLAVELPGASPQSPLRVLEIGAGIGTMAERLVNHNMLTHAVYTAVDEQPDNMTTAQKRLASLPATVRLELETADFYDYIAQHSGQRQWDLLIAHAVLDLTDVAATLPKLFALLAPGGLFYFSINFDGATILQPTIDLVLDAKIERLYHQTMDERVVNGRLSGDSQTGRHLFHQLRAAGGAILAAGGSDWVVFAGENGAYPDDEAYFLHFIIHTMHRALAGHPELETAVFDNWIAQRHAQVENGELVYIAHQLDFFGRV